MVSNTRIKRHAEFESHGLAPFSSVVNKIESILRNLFQSERFLKLISKTSDLQNWKFLMYVLLQESVVYLSHCLLLKYLI